MGLLRSTGGQAGLGLVLLAALSLAGCLRTAEAAGISPFPPDPRVGGTVTLHVDDQYSPVSCYWFRGNRFESSQKILHVKFLDSFIPGNAHTGRESVGWGCSLVIQGLVPSDSGEYAVFTTDVRGKPTKHVGRLQVSN